MIAAAVGAGDDELGVEHRAHRRLFGRGIEMAAASADRAAGAGLDVADVLQRARQKREARSDDRRRLARPPVGSSRRFRSIRRFPYSREIGNTVDVDQMIGRDHPKIHHRHQRLSAGENLGVLQMREHRAEFFARLRTVILKRRSLHAGYARSRNFEIALMNASGACAIGAWPHPGISINSAPGSALARARAISGGVAASSSPTTTRVGLRIVPM